MALIKYKRLYERFDVRLFQKNIVHDAQLKNDAES